jgi:hypothetical protein
MHTETCEETTRVSVHPITVGHTFMGPENSYDITYGGDFFRFMVPCIVFYVYTHKISNKMQH